MHLNLIILTLLASVSAFNPGGTFSIDFGTITEAKNTYFAFILNLVNKISIPNIGFHNGYISNNSFHISDSSSQVSLTPIGNDELQIAIKGLSATFHSSSLGYKVWFYTAHGSLDVDLYEVSLALNLKITTQKLSNGKTVPAVAVAGYSVDIPEDHISLHLHGDAIVEFASLFEGLFKGTVRNEIVGQINNALAKDVAPAINKLIAEQKGETEIWEGLSLDWSIMSAPEVNSKDLHFGIRGLFFKDGSAAVVPDVTPPIMPYIDSSNPSKVQAYVSNFLADSLGHTFCETIGFSIWIKSDVIPASSPIQLNTKSLAIFFPEIVNKYGDSSLVDLKLSITDLKNFTSVES